MIAAVSTAYRSCKEAPTFFICAERQGAAANRTESILASDQTIAPNALEYKLNSTISRLISPHTVRCRFLLAAYSSNAQKTSYITSGVWIRLRKSRGNIDQQETIEWSVILITGVATTN